MYRIEKMVTHNFTNYLYDVEGPFKDYFAAWRGVKVWREKEPNQVFIVSSIDKMPEDPKRHAAVR